MTDNTSKDNLMDLLRKDMGNQPSKHNKDTEIDTRIYPQMNDDELIELSEDDSFVKRKEANELKQKERGAYDVNAKRQRVLDIKSRVHSLKPQDIPEDIKVLKNGRWLQISTGKIVNPDEFVKAGDIEILEESVPSENNFFINLSVDEQRTKIRNRLIKMNNAHRRKQVQEFIRQNDVANNDASVVSRRATDSILLDGNTGIQEDNNGNLFIDDIEVTEEIHRPARQERIRRRINVADRSVRELANRVNGVNRGLISQHGTRQRRSELMNLHQELQKFPSHIKALFSSARSISEFESKIAKMLPADYTNNKDKMRVLKRMYFKYNELMGQGRYEQFVSEVEQQRIAPLAGGGTRINREMPRMHMFDPFNPFAMHEDQMASMQDINERIEAMEETHSRQRAKQLTAARKGIYQRHLDEVDNLPDDICSDFTDYVLDKNMKKVNICILCATPLRSGIPETFTGCKARDQSFEYLAKKHKVPCPYVALTAPTETDRVYSKRIFISTKCGHAYCGRCVMRISNSMKLPERLRKRRQNAVGCANPDIYGPKECVEQGCHANFNQKNVFREVFL